MDIKNLLDDLSKAISIAQAGIKGTLESLKKTSSKTKKRTVRIPASKKTVRDQSTTKPPAKPNQKKRVRNPSKLVIESRAVVARKPSK
jgi:hypothetical protein